MATAKIKKGDRVIVLSGKDKGKTGSHAGLPKDGKVVVGVSLPVTTSRPSQPGGIDRFEAPMSSQGCLADPKDGKPTRVRFEKDGKKVRCRGRETIDG